MREVLEKDWSKIFDIGVISVITDYQIQPKDGFGRTWYPESFKQNCPLEKKVYMIQMYLEFKRRGYDEVRIGEMLYKLPHVKKYNVPYKQ